LPLCPLASLPPHFLASLPLGFLASLHTACVFCTSLPVSFLH
jgi:hypothetical protein